MSTHPVNLNGLRILNTRPRAQGKLLTHAIHLAGGICLELPALTISAPSRPWLKALPNLHTIDQAIFISANAVNYFFNMLEQHHMTWPPSIRMIAIGDATAAAISERKCLVHQIPKIPNSEHLLQLAALQQINNLNILLIKGEGGRLLIAKTLASRGAHVTSLSVYRRRLPNISARKINSLWQDDCVDTILFTSQQTMHNLFTLFGKEALPWLRSKPCFVISQRLADTAAALGIETIITCSYDKLLNALAHFKKGLDL